MWKKATVKVSFLIFRVMYKIRMQGLQKRRNFKTEAEGRAGEHREKTGSCHLCHAFQMEKGKRELKV